MLYACSSSLMKITTPSRVRATGRVKSSVLAAWSRMCRVVQVGVEVGGGALACAGEQGTCVDQDERVVVDVDDA